MTGKGRIELGRQVSFGYKLGGRFRYGSIELQARSSMSLIKIGDFVSTNNNLFICSENCIEIGNHTLIGENVTIMDFDGHGIRPFERNQVGLVGKIIIDQNVWIGNDVKILRDSIIGENCVVATGSVVKGTFPPNVVIGGVPARIIKSIA